MVESTDKMCEESNNILSLVHSNKTLIDGFIDAYRCNSLEINLEDRYDLGSDVKQVSIYCFGMPMIAFDFNLIEAMEVGLTANKMVDLIVNSVKLESEKRMENDERKTSRRFPENDAKQLQTC